MVDGPVILRADDDNGAPFENGGFRLVFVESTLSNDQVNVPGSNRE